MSVATKQRLARKQKKNQPFANLAKKSLASSMDRDILTHAPVVSLCLNININSINNHQHKQKHQLTFTSDLPS